MTPWTVSVPVGQLVLPRDVVGCAHVVSTSTWTCLAQVLGDVARVLLGAAVDVGAVALDDDRDLHCGRRLPELGPGGFGARGLVERACESGSSAVRDRLAASSAVARRRRRDRRRTLERRRPLVDVVRTVVIAAVVESASSPRYR